MNKILAVSIHPLSFNNIFFQLCFISREKKLKQFSKHFNRDTNGTYIACCHPQIIHPENKTSALNFPNNASLSTVNLPKNLVTGVPKSLLHFCMGQASVQLTCARAEVQGMMFYQCENSW